MTRLPHDFGRYILEGHKPIACPDLKEWAIWLAGADRHVAVTRIGGFRVSTVFLGLDHSFCDVPPLLFETMIYNDQDHEWLDYQERYSTWAEAEAGHRRAVAMILDRRPAQPAEEPVRAEKPGEPSGR